MSSSGQRFTLASLRGKIVVVSDAMTLCQETSLPQALGVLSWLTTHHIPGAATGG